MNLTKFLRKNTRILLMVFMSFLLVAFLVPNQVQGCGQDRRNINFAVGEVFGETVYAEDMQRYRHEISVLQGILPLPPQIAGDERVYYLLTEEARRSGVRVGREAAKQQLVEMGVTNEFLKAVNARTRVSYDQLYDIVGKWMGVLWLAEMQASAMTDSLPREKHAYRNQFQEAIARVSILDAEAFLPLVPEPTEEQLQAFFEEHKSEKQGHTEAELQFGYRLPDRVRVEYLTVDPADVARKIRVKSSQVEQFFEDHRNRYTKPDPAAGNNPQAPQIPMTFEEARFQVKEDLRLQRAIEEAQRIVNEMKDEADAPWRASVPGEDGFLEPTTTDFASFEALRDKYSDRYPVQYAQTELVPMNELQRMRGFGQASIGSSQRRTYAWQMAGSRVKGILEDATDGGPALVPMQPGPVMMAPDPTAPQNRAYQAYLFRVSEVAPSAPPASLDDVREEVTEDWKLSEAYRLAQQHAESLAETARAVGLDEAVAQAEELRALLEQAEVAATQPADGSAPPPRAPRYVADLEPHTPERLTRTTRMMRPKLGATTTIPKGIFALADEPAGDDAHRVGALPFAKEFQWVVAELLDVQPIYEKPFEQQLQASRSNPQTDMMKFRIFLMDWFQPENVMKRTGFKDLLAAAQ
jgi:hypothetical protein